MSDGDTSSGRESVTTVISNSSNETLKCHERHSSSETLRWGGEDEVESRAVRRQASHGEEAAHGQEWPHEAMWRPQDSDRLASSRRLLYRSHSEAGAMASEAGDFNDSFRQNLSDFDTLRQGERQALRPDLNSHLGSLQKAGRGGGGGPEPRLPDGAMLQPGSRDWGGQQPRHCSYCLGRHNPAEECRTSQDSADLVSFPPAIKRDISLLHPLLSFLPHWSQRGPLLTP